MTPAPVLLARLLAGADDPDALEWARRGFLAWQRTGDPAAAFRAWRLPATPAACARALRDAWLIEAGRFMPARNRAELLRRAIAGEPVSPAVALCLTRAAAAAPLPTTARQLRAILAEGKRRIHFPGVHRAA